MAIPGFLTALALKGDLAVPAWMMEFSAPDLNTNGIGVRTYSDRGQNMELAAGGVSPVVLFEVPTGSTGMKYLARCWIVSHKDGSEDDGIRGLYLAYFKADDIGDLSATGEDQTLLTTVANDFLAVTIAPATDPGPPGVLAIVVTNSALANLSISIYVTWMIFKTGNSVPCFTRETLIHTPYGSAEIQDVSKGDVVWAYSHDRKRVVEGEVLATHVHEEKEIWELTLEGDPKPLLVTDNHPFWVPHRGEYVQAGGLEPGFELLDLRGHGSHSRVLELNKRGEKRTVYNFTVADHSNYFVGRQAVLVHNK